MQSAKQFLLATLKEPKHFYCECKNVVLLEALKLGQLWVYEADNKGRLDKIPFS